jgi:delta-aminolevulinic acid dehydratase/porphobilinogen synthase
MFIAEGENVQVEISSMPGIFAVLSIYVKERISILGIRAVNICKSRRNLKDNAGTEAWNPTDSCKRHSCHQSRLSGNDCHARFWIRILFMVMTES